jgi:ABC-type transporter Mla maintaining outer membrane lipid asymmetry ATPase subunit MlaF
VAIVPADELKANEAEFMMLRDGRIYFEGTGADLRASRDPYIRRFLT